MQKIGCDILCAKNMHYYITDDIPFKLQKTRKRSPPPFSRCTSCKSGLGEKGGLEDQHKYSFVYSKILYVC